MLLYFAILSCHIACLSLVNLVKRGVEVFAYSDTNSPTGLTLSEETSSALYAEKVSLSSHLSAALSSIWLLKLYHQ